MVEIRECPEVKIFSYGLAGIRFLLLGKSNTFRVQYASVLGSRLEACQKLLSVGAHFRTRCFVRSH